MLATNLDRRTDTYNRQRIFRPDIEDTPIGTHGISRRNHAFNDPERIRFQHHTVHESARIALIAVTDHIFLLLVDTRDDLPFLSGHETTAATATQAALEDGLHHLIGFHLPQRLL